MNKLKVRIGTLQIDEAIKPLTDYALTLRIARKGKYLPDSQGEETEVETYDCQVIAIELLQEIGTRKEINFREIKSKSKQLRDMIWRLGNKKGVKDDETFYDETMNKLMTLIAKKIEEN